MAKRGLGRGLSSLIPTLGSTADVVLEEIPVGDISPSPNQPRKQFDQEAFEELVASIGRHGLVQPVVVRPKGSGFELVAGERRWRAAKEAGLKTVPAIVKQSTDGQSLELALIENIQREDLNALEEAAAYQKLIGDFKLTQAELADRVGKNRTTITNTLRLLQLPDSIKQLILEGQLSSGHARALLALENEDQQRKLAEKVLAEGLSVRQTESLVRLWQLAADGAPARPPVRSFGTAARQLAGALSARVRVRMSGGKGKIEIEFKSEEELKRICDLVAPKSSSQAPDDLPG